MTVVDPLTNFNFTVVYNDTMTTLTRTDMSADGGGEYECVAGNLVGQAQIRTDVRVQCEWWWYGSGSDIVSGGGMVVSGSDTVSGSDIVSGGGMVVSGRGIVSGGGMVVVVVVVW